MKYKTASTLKQLITERKATIGVIGLGYVGLPLAVEFAEVGFKVIGVDVDSAKVEGIRQGKSHVEDVPSESVATLVKQNRLSAQAHFRGCGKFDAIFICVPTPLSKTKDPDISYIVSAVGEICKELRRGQVILLESTTYPGTTEEIVRPQLETGGLKAGEDFFLGFSPERVDPGNQTYHTQNTPKVVGGISKECTQVASHLYGQVIQHVHPVSSTQCAEMIKLLENTFRAVNIALVNEISLMCDKLELDVWEVIDGAATKPFGFMRFYPGPGIGGHCIPLDPHYLSWKLRTLNYSARFIELASEINSNMPLVVVRKMTELLNKDSKSVKGSRIFALGVAYKKDTSDLRESPALDVMALLQQRGAKLMFHDPYNKTVKLDDGRVYKRSALTAANLSKADVVIILTDHSVYDFGMVVENALRVLDTRNATSQIRRGRSKITRL